MLEDTETTKLKFHLQTVLTPEMEENLMLLRIVLTMEHRGGISAGDFVVRHAVGHYIRGTSYEDVHQRRCPTACCESTKPLPQVSNGITFGLNV